MKEMRLPWRGHAGAVFHYPSGEPPVTMVLATAFAPSRVVHVVPDVSQLSPAECTVDAVAGTVEQLRQAAVRGITVSRGVVVFTYEDGACLRDEERDYLWERFGVPVFEQYLSRTNELLASECDAHDGLHLTAGAGARAGFTIDEGRCPCGDPRPRYIQLSEPDEAAEAERWYPVPAAL